MSAPRPTPTPPIPPAAARRPVFVVAGLILALLAGGAVWAYRRPPLLPIPTPANLGTLDPQVRQHLAQIVRRIGEAPRDPEPRADLGLAFAVNGLWSEARVSFLDSLRLGPARPLPLVYAAVALGELGDDTGAIRELRDATRQFPDFAPGWHRLGRALLAAGDPDGARAAFETVTRLAPESWHGWAGIGEACIRAGHATDAIAPLERARQLDPAARSVRHLLGQAYRAAGRTAEADAESAAGKAQSLTPMPDEWSPRALAHMKLVADQIEQADALVARGDPRTAIALLRESLGFHPTNAVVLVSLTRALTADNQAETAWNLLSAALAQRPDEPLLLGVAVEAAAASGRTNEALALADRAVALTPAAAEAQVARANALLGAGRDADAAEALRAAIRLAPSLASLRTQLGDLLRHNLARPDEARALYAEALRLDPLDLGTRFRLADLEVAANHPDEAARQIEGLRALGADPAALRELAERLKPAAPRP